MFAATTFTYIHSALTNNSPIQYECGTHQATARRRMYRKELRVEYPATQVPRPLAHSLIIND